MLTRPVISLITVAGWKGGWRRRAAAASVLALFLVLLPAVVFAAKAGSPFAAQVFLAVYDGGDVKYVPHGKDGDLLQITKGEKLFGQVMSIEGWDEMDPTQGHVVTLDVEHDSTVVYNPSTGEFTDGKAREWIELYRNGELAFKGKSKAELYGQIDPAPCADEGEIKGQVFDVGTVSFYKGYGEFKGQTAEGTWSAELNAVCGDPGDGSLIPLLFGMAEIEGIHFDKAGHAADVEDADEDEEEDDEEEEEEDDEEDDEDGKGKGRGKHKE